MNIIRNSRGSKYVSSLMAVIFLFFTINPGIAYGLSTGPAQPELEAFTPIGADNMVDLFTGDFSYNLPLLNVPGPGGGYPLNLSYNAGPSMEQEATWVGLGWNLNAGVINREVRGVPDDFNGEEVIKTLKQKPNRTFGVGLASEDVEILGADLQKIIPGNNIETSGNVNIIYNNYKGFDVKAGVGFSLISADEAKAPNSATQTEVVNESSGNVAITKSFADVIQQNLRRDHKNFSFSNLKHDFSSHFKNLARRTADAPFESFGRAMSQSIANVGYTHPMTSSSYTLNAKFGLDILGTTKDVQVEVYYKDQKVKEEVIEVPAYGYLHSENNFSQAQSGLMDFTLGNQSMITPDSRILPVPNFANDVFHIKSHGVSGAARAYRGGVSVLTDPTIESGTKNYGGGGEANSSGASNKIGVNLNGGVVNAYSGPWTAGDESVGFLKNSLNDKKVDIPTFEPYFFKFSDELTAQTNVNGVFATEQAYRFGLATRMGAATSEAKLLSNTRGSSFSSLNAGNSFRTQRESRAKVFVPLTEEEASNYYGSYVRQVEDLADGTLKNVNYNNASSPEKDKIGAIHVTDESGTNYIYGIPAKNLKHKENTFSIDADYGTGLSNLISKTVNYSPLDNSRANSRGQDEYYSSTETPQHAHSFLLTEILSEGYVDIDDNGPTPEDFGTYVKFDYYTIRGFETKSPLLGANYLPGKLSNNADDKATISYFKKDLFYLKSVSTKTHIAIFTLNEDPDFRGDGRGVIGENDPSISGKRQKYLKKITLYNLEDYTANGASATPVKTVNFEYSSSPLCAGAYNGAGGKLTLEKVWYSIGDERTKKSLSPYTFTYDKNFDYNQNHVDKWSSYQPDSSNIFGSNILYPYSSQNKVHADAYAGAWSLSRIGLPTGGEIRIEYEADDYRYVQDKEALGMYRILGFSNSSSGTGFSPTLNMLNPWMVVELPDYVTQAQAEKLVTDTKDIYFKAFMRMKNFGQNSLAPDGTPFSDGSRAHDFVEGYLDLDDSETPVLYGNPGESNRIAIKIKANGIYHPIKKAGWLELQMERADLMDDSGISLSGLGEITDGMLGAIGQIVRKAVSFFTSQNSFFIKAAAKGWCSELSNQGSLSSIVRLNTLGNKIGGGYRVKEISISDEWGAMDGGSPQAYGQKYFYEIAPGVSSGVAQYEPLTGGEENPFRKPVRYSTGGVPIKNNHLYAELPVGESFYPAPSVGYSRVVVKSLANDYGGLVADGIKVHEFYTAKDYPLETDYTGIEKINTGFATKMIRFAGAKNFFQPGFSQGFSVETNDMHGKSKAVSRYISGTNINDVAPVEKTEYYYKTRGGYHPGKRNYLDNTVEVVYGEGLSEQRKIGITQDSYLHLRENHERAIYGDLDGQGEYTLPFFFVPTAFPTLDYSYTMTRTAVTNHVVSKAGILEKVVHSIDGAKTVTENLTFDYETGDPILTSVNDFYGNRLYNYRQLAKWYYDEMGGAYKNVGIEIIGNINNYADYLVPGDLLMNNTGNKVWVTENTGTAVTCRGSDGNIVSALSGYKVLKSGYGNNLREVMGNIQTTKNPTSIDGLGQNIPLFEVYNSTKDDPGFDKKCDVLNCKTGQISTISVTTRMIPDGSVQDFEWDFLGGTIGDCSGDDFVTVQVQGIDGAYNIDDFSILYVGNNQVIIQNSSGYSKPGIIIGGNTGTELPNDFYECFVGCLKGVLNASASTYSDGLQTSHDVPSSVSSQVAFSTNPYKYNFKGIYKPNESLFYPGSRTQAGESSIAAAPHDYLTNIDTDGEYDKFYWFDPGAGAPNLWQVAKEITFYDHNGEPVEERDASGNYSAVLYGHDRSLPIAIARNSRYNELAFDGFEEHGSTYQVDKKDNHINLGPGVTLNDDYAHSGQYSAKITTGEVISIDLSDDLSLDDGKKYLIQAWHKVGSGGYLAVNNGSEIEAKSISPNIEGWELLEIVFTASTSNTLKLSGQHAQFDDLKIQPFHASVKAFIYDKLTHQLIVQLDESHFGTIYNYDREQVLVQVKKETQRGVKTIQSTQRVSPQNIQ